MNRPLAEAHRQRAQHPPVAGCLADSLEVVAVHQFMIVGRVAPSTQLLDVGLAGGPKRHAVLARQVERYLEDLFATDVNAAMAVEVGRLQASIQNVFDLGAILPL